MIERLNAVLGRDVSRETFDALSRYAAMLAEEAQRQNLISQRSLVDLWERHIVDSAQLVPLSPGSTNWCDIGSGAGLPGLVIAILSPIPITLVEPRPLRANFLLAVAQELALSNVTVATSKVERVVGHFDTVTARAVAPLDKMFGLTAHLSHSRTRWVLPKGRNAKSELDEARRNWQGVFSLVPSVTSDEAAIVIAEGVRRRGKS